MKSYHSLCCCCFFLVFVFLLVGMFCLFVCCCCCCCYMCVLCVILFGQQLLCYSILARMVFLVKHTRCCSHCMYMATLLFIFLCFGFLFYYLFYWKLTLLFSTSGLKQKNQSCKTLPGVKTKQASKYDRQNKQPNISKKKQELDNAEEA